MKDLDSQLVEVLESEMANNPKASDFLEIVTNQDKFQNLFKEALAMKEQFDTYLKQEHFLDQIYDRFIKLYSQKVGNDAYIEDFKSNSTIMISRFLKEEKKDKTKFAALLWHFVENNSETQESKYISKLSKSVMDTNQFLNEGIKFVSEYTNVRMINFNKSAVQSKLGNSQKFKKQKTNKNQQWNPINTSNFYMQSQINSFNKLSFIGPENGTLRLSVDQQNNVSMLNVKKPNKEYQDSLSQSQESGQINMDPLKKQETTNQKKKKKQKKQKQVERTESKGITFSQEFIEVEKDKEQFTPQIPLLNQGEGRNSIPQIEHQNSNPQHQLSIKSPFSQLFDEAAKEKDSHHASPQIGFAQRKNSITTPLRLDSANHMDSGLAANKKLHFSWNSTQPNYDHMYQSQQDSGMQTFHNNLSEQFKVKASQVPSINNPSDFYSSNRSVTEQNLSNMKKSQKPVQNPESFSKIMSDIGQAKPNKFEERRESIRPFQTPIVEQPQREDNEETFSRLFEILDANQEVGNNQKENWSIRNDSQAPIMIISNKKQSNDLLTTTEVLGALFQDNLSYDTNSPQSTSNRLSQNMSFSKHKISLTSIKEEDQVILASRKYSQRSIQLIGIQPKQLSDSFEIEDIEAEFQYKLPLTKESSSISTPKVLMDKTKQFSNDSSSPLKSKIQQ